MDKYIILQAKNMDGLATLVNSAIESGYTPQSGPVSNWKGVYQAMVLKEAIKPGPTEFKSRSKN